MTIILTTILWIGGALIGLWCILSGIVYILEKENT